MFAKKFSKVAIDFAAMSDGRNNHSHGLGNLRGREMNQMMRSYEGAVLTVKPSCGNTSI